MNSVPVALIMPAFSDMHSLWHRWKVPVSADLPAAASGVWNGPLPRSYAVDSQERSQLRLEHTCVIPKEPCLSLSNGFVTCSQKGEITVSSPILALLFPVYG